MVKSHSAEPAAKAPPRLAPPGAGLPPLEKFFARLIVQWKSRRTSRQAAEQLFAKERDAILSLVNQCDPATAATPALIKRLAGMEDSSRYWSVLMVLDHLRIVNFQMTAVILQLTKGKVPGTPASTAAVKPNPAVTQAVVTSFAEGCARFQEIIAGIPALTPSVKFEHPWFGLMDAGAWHFLAGFHMALHRKQIERILTELGSPH